MSIRKHDTFNLTFDPVKFIKYQFVSFNKKPTKNKETNLLKVKYYTMKYTENVRK